MQLKDFDYELPKELIAQKALKQKDQSKLMIVDETIKHKKFYEITKYFTKGDVIVINETKVKKARIKGKKKTGTKATFIIEKNQGKKATGILAMKRPKIGNELIFGKYKAKIIGEKKEQYKLEFDEEVEKIMKEIGELPTPPYIKEKLEKNSGYQTCYSKTEGSIAAPTAGLHFTKELIKKLEKKGVKIAKICLHVGFGTFMPVRDINKKKLHSETYEVSEKAAKIINERKGKLIAVGTTTIRTLESTNKKGKIIPGKGKTEIFIKPGYKFKTKIDAMITNFHLPKSTLLMLVSAYIGREKILKAYKKAIKEKYRFYSLGDAMIIWKK